MMQRHTPDHVDPRSPLVLDTRDLSRTPGAMRMVERAVPAPEGFGSELMGVPPTVVLHLSLRLQSVSEGILVSGTATAPVAGECGRCLRPIRDTLEASIEELYVYAHSTTDETTDEDEVGRLQGDLIDLEPVLRDAVVLSLPNHPLCRQDCPGLCPDCGVPRDDLLADHSHQRMDSRWAALSEMTSNTTVSEQE